MAGHSLITGVLLHRGSLPRRQYRPRTIATSAESFAFANSAHRPRRSRASPVIMHSRLRKMQAQVYFSNRPNHCGKIASYVSISKRTTLTSVAAGDDIQLSAEFLISVQTPCFRPHCQPTFLPGRDSDLRMIRPSLCRRGRCELAPVGSTLPRGTDHHQQVNQHPGDSV